MSDALVITGATATGKTGLSIRVAQQLDAEIVSMDSRQVYRGLDIATAKATREQQAAVPHHGLDLVSPAERYNAGRFARDARAWIDRIRARGRTALLVGGTGFFLRALTHPMFEEPPLEPVRRDRLEAFFAGIDDRELLRWLATLDPPSARRFAAQGGRQRVLRALELALLTGRPIGWWHAQAAADVPPLNVRVVVLELPRDLLFDRIDARVHDMVNAGLVGEVRAILEAGFDAHDPGMNTTGVIELIPYLRGETTLAAAIDATQRATRRYARRQLTWFRHQLPADVIRLDATRPLDELTEDVVRFWTGD